MTDNKTGSTTMRPHFEEIQAHYDLSDDFFGVFQDPSRTYSCAFYERQDMNLAEAQMAKIDLALGKLDLQAGMTLLDVGCGWGSVMKRAIEKHDVNVIGLTLSKNQSAFGQRLLDAIDTDRSARCSCAAGRSSTSLDTVVHRGVRGLPQRAVCGVLRDVLPHPASGGRMVLQTIMGHPLKRWPDMGVPITISDLKFMRFIAKEIFPGGSIPCDEDIVELSRAAGFSLEDTQFLNKHYVRTLDAWAENLEAARDEAIAATSVEVYERYMRYLTGCADFFRRGISELGQFTLTKG